MNLLMHVCCAPCANLPIETLREEGISLSAFWYNPNIHPFTEYRARKNTMVSYAKEISLPLVVQEEYGLRRFVKAVSHDIDGRCAFCYTLRMEETAKYAAENGFTHFTTSLIISPYQDYEGICAVARAAAEKYGVSFFERDFRPLFRDGQARAREMGLYMQKYCGCIFSEEDRYCNKPKKKAKSQDDLSC